MRRALPALVLVIGVLFGMAGVAGAQSGGCPGGPYEGATPTDSDGDGVSDADEVVAGTDECDPADPPVVETADGTADGAGIITVEADPPTNTAAQPPTLALTGPSFAMIVGFLGILLVTLGGASLLIGRRLEA